MDAVGSILKLISDTPPPTILLVAGLLFLLLSIAGRLGAIVVVNSQRQAIAGIVGTALLVIGVLLHVGVVPNGGTALNRELVLSRTWQFLHGEGDVISPDVRLDASGAILGIDHPNESRWGLESGILVFYNASGVPSTRFTNVQKENGKLRLTGRLLLPGHQPVVEHVLRER